MDKSDSASGKSHSIKPELVRVNSNAAGAAKSAATSGAQSVAAPHWSSAVNIISFRTPVKKISLEQNAGNQDTPIYTCSGPDDSCLVELNGTALDDLLGARSVLIPEGRYTSVGLNNCADGEMGYRSYITATVTLNGTVYFTKSAGSLAPTAPAEPVAIAYQGCGKSYALPESLFVDDSLGQDITLKLFFDIQNLAWAGLNERETQGAWAPGDCTGPTPGDGTDIPFICAGYPDIAGTTDTLSPTLERYYINEGAVIGLFFRPQEGAFVGGYSRRYLREGIADHAGFEAVTPVQLFTSNGDGSYHLELGGNGTAGDFAFSSLHFLRAAHSGTWTRTSAGGGSGAYTSTLTPP